MPRETSVVRLHSPDIHVTPRRRRQKRGNDAGPVSAHKARTRLVLAAHEGLRVQRVPVRAVLVHVQRAQAQRALDGGERHVGRAEAVAHQVEEPAEDDAEDTGGPLDEHVQRKHLAELAVVPRRHVRELCHVGLFSNFGIKDW